MKKAVSTMGCSVFLCGFLAVTGVSSVTASTESGSFSAWVPSGQYVPAVELPTGAGSIRIDLSAGSDLDIQLFDSRGTVVGYPSGQIGTAGAFEGRYRDLTIRYSGYNGVAGDAGREYLEIEGSLPESMIVAMYGYRAGHGELSFEWQASDSTSAAPMEIIAPLPAGVLAWDVTLFGDRVYVGTDDGLYRCTLPCENGWEKLADFGGRVYSVWVHPDDDSLIVVGLSSTDELMVNPLRRSTDGGRSWQAVGEIFGLGGGSYVGAHEITFEPGTGELFVAGPGASIARSRDLGDSWEWVNGSADSFGYYCMLGVLPAAPGELYQGCEAAAFDIVDVYRHRLSDMSQSKIIEWPEIGNRRPNVMQSFEQHPDRLFVGVEGGLLTITSDHNWEWLYKAEDNGDGVDQGLRYTYVNTIWADSMDPGHVVFGGSAQTPDDGLELYETVDGGATVRRVPMPEGLPVGDETRIRAGDVAGRDLVFAYTTDIKSGGGDSDQARSYLAIYRAGQRAN